MTSRTTRSSSRTSTSSGSTTWTRAFWKSIIEKFDGGPVGINTIAAAVGEDASTIEEVYEPFLVQNGFHDAAWPNGNVDGVPPFRLYAAGRFEPAVSLLGAA